MYFESNLKHVLIHCKNGGNIRISAKLSKIEGQLGTEFVRIHKSYIVNRIFVQRLNKRTHVRCMTDSRELPVSEAQYGRVVDTFMNI